MSKKLHQPRTMVLASLTGIALATSMGLPAMATEQPQSPDIETSKVQGLSFEKLPEQKISGDLIRETGVVSVYVQLTGEGAFEQTQPQAVKNGTQKPVKAVAEVKDVRREIQAKAREITNAASAEQLYVTTNSLPGVAITGDAEAVRALAERPDVVKISAIIPKTVDNKGGVIDTEALNSWVERNETGEDITIAVLDTGVDYTHTAFGGPGTQEAYDAAQASDTFPPADSGLYDPEKFAGGWDLVGDSYNAANGPGYQPIPNPDPNPLDCATAGHGSHVAGTAAGYGVNADGTTFDGDYSSLTAEQVNEMKMGPGTAPEAMVVSIRVFGCAGSSAVVGQALDYVLDPNADGDFSDRAQVVNMSLGSDFSSNQDPEYDIVNELTSQGILSVVSAGNSGDIQDIGGTPGAARSSLTVANSIGSQVTMDRIDVLAPADVAGPASGQYSVNYNYQDATEEELTGEVVVAPAANRFGCSAFEPGSLEGKWVWLQWEEDGEFPCGSGARFNNAEAGGAEGVLLDSPRDVFDAGIAGNATIPGAQFNREFSDKLRPAAEAGTLEVRLDPDYLGAGGGNSGAKDTLNSSSSRGVHGSNGVVKPDVAAPGTSIGSVAVASGNGVSVKTGTSMAAPNVAGIAALMYSATDYNPYEIKNIIMNTANTDILTAPDGIPYGPNRVGSGRVNALDALSTDVFAYDAENQDLTTSNFGVVEVGDEGLSITREITVESTSDRTSSYNLSYLPATTMPGVEYSVAPTVNLPANGKATVELTMTVTDPAALEKRMDPTMASVQLGLARQFLASASGRLQLAAEGAPTLRVPVFAAPKPTADLTAGEEIVFDSAQALEAEVTLSGRDLNQGSGSERYLSVIAPFQLHTESPRSDADLLNISRGVDLQYVGANTTVPALAAAGDDVNDGMINFGFSTWANWATLSPAIQFTIDIDTTGDGEPDFRTYTARATGLDLTLANTVQINPDGSTSVVDQYGVNGVTGALDTNTFDTNVVSLPVSVAALGLDVTESAPITYTVSTWSRYNVDNEGNLAPVDETEPVTFDAAQPDLWFEGEVPDYLFSAQDGQTLTTHRAEGVTDAKALFLHYHNATGDLSGDEGDGGKAEVLPIEVPAGNVTTVSTVCERGSVHLVFTATNTEDRRMDATFQSAHGRANLRNVEPGDTKTVKFNTRLDAIDAGEIRATLRYKTQGPPETEVEVNEYDAFTCGR